MTKRMTKLTQRYLALGLSEKRAKRLALNILNRKPVWALRRSWFGGVKK